MSNTEANVTVPLGLRQIKENYEHILELEKAHIARVSELRAQFYAKIYLKSKIDKIGNATIARTLGVGKTIIGEWVKKGGKHVS